MRLCGGLVGAYLYTSDKFVRIVCACWICAIALICHPEEVGATAGDEEAKRGAADYKCEHVTEQIVWRSSSYLVLTGRRDDSSAMCGILICACKWGRWASCVGCRDDDCHIEYSADSNIS